MKKNFLRGLSSLNAKDEPEFIKLTQTKVCRNGKCLLKFLKATSPHSYTPHALREFENKYKKKLPDYKAKDWLGQHKPDCS